MSTWPIIIISLRDAASRRARLIDFLERFGLCYTIFNAIDGRSGLPQEFEKLIDRAQASINLRRSLTDAEYACALSHHMIYRKILDESHSGALVLEDDADPNDLFIEAWRSKFFRKYDFLQWNYGFCRIWRTALFKKKETSNLLSARIVSNAGLASAYTLSHRAAAYLVKHGLPISLPADWPCDLRPLKPRVVIPKPVITPDVDVYQSHLEDGRAAAKMNQVFEGQSRTRREFLTTRRARNPLPSYPSFIYRVLSEPQ